MWYSVPCVGHDAEHGNGIDTLGRLLAGQLHHSTHHVSKRLSHWLSHTTTCDVTHTWTTLDYRTMGGREGGTVPSQIITLEGVSPVT